MDEEDVLALSPGYALPAGVVTSFDEARGIFTVRSDVSAGLKYSDYNQILGNIIYSNLGDNPGDNAIKRLTVSAVDADGARGAPVSQNIKILPANDNPEIYVEATGLNSGVGEPFVEGGGIARLAPNITILDVDNSTFTEARIEQSSYGSIALTKTGAALAKANGLVLSEPGSARDYYLLSSDSGAPIPKSALQGILREVGFTSESKFTEAPSFPASGNLDVVLNVTVIDAGGGSGDFASTITLLAAPSVQVDGTQADDLFSTFSLDENSAPSREQIALLDKTFSNVAIFNPTFFARDLFFDLETSTIRTEAGRFIYDRALNSLDLSAAGHVDLSRMSGAEKTATDLGTSATVFGQPASELILDIPANDKIYSDKIVGSRFNDFLDGRGGYDLISGGFGDDTIVYHAGEADKYSVYDGNGGDSNSTADNDTLLLPASFLGGSVSLSSLESSINSSVTVKSGIIVCIPLK